jgi:F-type H+-transporting ATPase subunit alpha
MQTLNPSEISELIRSRIEKVKLTAEARNEGTVTSVSDGIVKIHGLADAMQGEMIELPGNTFALALNLERDSVGAVVLGDYENLREGATAKTTGRILEVPVGPELLGRVLNALGEPIDGKGPAQRRAQRAGREGCPGVIWRKSVSQPVQTGYKSVDAMIPIGRGQRELIIGDRQTGKSAMAVDTIINQKGTGVKCIYVAIGQKAFDRRQRGAPPDRQRRDGPHHRRRRHRRPSRPRCSTSAPTPAAPWASTSATAAKTR